MNPRVPLPLRVLAPAALLWVACAQTRTSADSSAAAAAVVRPTLEDTAPADLPGVHNVVAYAVGLYSGGVPEGEEGFATLAAMGVKTLVSVDGATPDLAAAKHHGLRYVHLPISYDSVPPARARELAQVIANVQGPIYLHCHHGKHRSASALAVGAVLAGRLTPAAACERMKVSGTSADYEGLWASVREAAPMAAQDLRADSKAFPEVNTVSGMVAVMAQVDEVFDNVKALQRNGWKVPGSHPDLVPPKEAKRLHELFLALQKDAESMAKDANYQRMLGTMLDATQKLEAAVNAGDAAAANAQFDLAGKTCKACHKPYRDS